MDEIQTELVGQLTWFCCSAKCCQKDQS